MRILAWITGATFAAAAVAQGQRAPDTAALRALPARVSQSTSQTGLRLPRPMGPVPGECVRLLPQDLESRDSTGALVAELPGVAADSSRHLAVAFVHPRTLGHARVLGGAYMVAVAGPTVLCYGGFHSSRGIDNDRQVVSRWNAALPRVAPGLGIGTADSALILAKLVLTFATGVSVDSSTRFRFLDVTPTAGAWTITGLVLWGFPRSFLVRLKPDGQLDAYSFQERP